MAEPGSSQKSNAVTITITAQASVNGTPAAGSTGSAGALALNVGGNGVTHYKYKVVAGNSCSGGTYIPSSSWRAVSTSTTTAEITDTLTQTGQISVCVLGATDVNGANAQEESSATKHTFTRTAPAQVPTPPPPAQTAPTISVITLCTLNINDCTPHSVSNGGSLTSVKRYFQTVTGCSDGGKATSLYVNGNSVPAHTTSRNSGSTGSHSIICPSSIGRSGHYLIYPILNAGNDVGSYSLNNGQNTIQVRYADGTASQTFTITITAPSPPPAQTAPTITAIGVGSGSTPCREGGSYSPWNSNCSRITNGGSTTNNKIVYIFGCRTRTESLSFQIKKDNGMYANLAATHRTDPNKNPSTNESACPTASQSATGGNGYYIVYPSSNLWNSVRDPGTYKIRVARSGSSQWSNPVTITITPASPPADTTPPTVSITPNPLSITGVGVTSTITVRFSEAVTGFVAAELTASVGTLSNFAGSGTTYTATYTPPANSDGTANINVAAGVAQDAAGNDNTAAPQRSITYNTRPPVTPPIIFKFSLCSSARSGCSQHTVSDGGLLTSNRRYFNWISGCSDAGQATSLYINGSPVLAHTTSMNGGSRGSNSLHCPSSKGRSGHYWIYPILNAGEETGRYPLDNGQNTIQVRYADGTASRTFRVIITASDNTPPTVKVRFNEPANPRATTTTATVTATDAESGVGSIKWKYVTSATQSCPTSASSYTNTPALTVSGKTKTATITDIRLTETRKICVIATNTVSLSQISSPKTVPPKPLDRSASDTGSDGWNLVGRLWNSVVGWVYLNCDENSRGEKCPFDTTTNSKIKVTYKPGPSELSGIAYNPIIGEISFNKEDVNNCPATTGMFGSGTICRDGSLTSTPSWDEDRSFINEELGLGVGDDVSLLDFVSPKIYLVSKSKGELVVLTEAGNEWTRQNEKVTSPTSISASGNKVAVFSDTQETEGSSKKYKIHVFDTADSDAIAKKEVEFVTNSDTTPATSLAISDSLIVLGVSNIPTNTGSVRYWKKQGGRWGSMQTLTLPDPSTVLGFGYSVATDGDTLVVGAPATNSSQGKVYVYNAKTLSKIKTLQPPPRQPPSSSSRWFGWSVAIDGDTLVVGASWESAIYIYETSDLDAEPEKETVESVSYLGQFVSVKGNTIAVDSGFSGRESVYLYRKQGNSWERDSNSLAGSNPVLSSSGARVLVASRQGPRDNKIKSVKLYARTSSETATQTCDCRARIINEDRVHKLTGWARVKGFKDEDHNFGWISFDNSNTSTSTLTLNTEKKYEVVVRSNRENSPFGERELRGWAWSDNFGFFRFCDRNADREISSCLGGERLEEGQLIPRDLVNIIPNPGEQFIDISIRDSGVGNEIDVSFDCGNLVSSATNFGLPPEDLKKPSGSTGRVASPGILRYFVDCGTPTNAGGLTTPFYTKRIRGEFSVEGFLGSFAAEPQLIRSEDNVKLVTEDIREYLSESPVKILNDVEPGPVLNDKFVVSHVEGVTEVAFAFVPGSTTDKNACSSASPYTDFTKEGNIYSTSISTNNGMKVCVRVKTGTTSDNDVSYRYLLSSEKINIATGSPSDTSQDVEPEDEPKLTCGVYDITTTVEKTDADPGKNLIGTKKSINAEGTGGIAYKWSNKDSAYIYTITATTDSGVETEKRYELECKRDEKPVVSQFARVKIRPTFFRNFLGN
ncbi:MAG: Ig-like domain-containing protein [Candidatus Campbellbacteria bacterium]|nr:Ig-like domain-containing protein [Candidatus Campbellbacteria bacterium]